VTRLHTREVCANEPTGAGARRWQPLCSLYLWHDDEKVPVLTATNGSAQSGVGRARLGLGDGVTGWVASRRTHCRFPTCASNRDSDG
jgi:hypothetical protein